MELFKRYHSITNQFGYTLPTGEKVYPAVVDVKKGMQGGGDISYVETDNNVGFIIVSLVEGESKFKIPSTATVTCNIKRPDGHFLEIDCTKMDESTVQIALGSAGTKVEGVHSFDIKIQYSDDIVIGTPIMSYMVQSGLTLDGAIEEDERLPMLTALIEEVKIIHESTTELAEEVSELSENIGAIVEGAGVRLDEEIAEFRMQSEELIDSANLVIEEVNNSLEQITTSLEEVNQGIDEVNDAISDVNNALEEVGNNMDRVDSVIIEASQAIESMGYTQNTSIELNEQSEMLISEMQGLIADGLDIEELINARDGEESLSVRLDRDLQGVYEYVDNKQIDLSPVESKIAENANKITANTDKLTTYKELIDDNTANVVNHDTRITANTNAINQNVADILSTRQEITTEVNNLKTEVVEDIANINDNVARLQEELQKSENTKYTTENGVKEFSCKDGYVDNIVIEGETLVNLVNLSTVNELEQLFYVHNEPYLMFSNKTYTVVNNFNKCVYFEIKDFAGIFLRSYLVHPNSSYKISLSENECVLSIAFKKVDGWTFELVEGSKNSGAIILEGDHTDKPISYFEGLKSVGQGDKIEVVSQGGNIFDGMFEYGSIKTSDGTLTDTTECIRSVNYLPIDVKDLFSWNDKNYSFVTFYYDKNKNYISSGGNTPPSNARYLKFRSSYNSNQNDLSARWVVSYKKVDNYIPSQIDKKQISTTLRSLPNGVKDTIEKRGNKYYLIQRCKEVELTEDNVLQLTNAGATANTMYFHVFYKGGIKDWAEGNMLCDKFPTNKTPHGINDNQGLWFEDVEGIGYVRLSEDSFRVRIAKNKLSSHNVEGFKAWLKNNPIKVVCELVSPEIIELPNFNPQTYEGDTTLLLNTGVIQGECEFEVTNSMGSEIEVLKDKVSSLDCDYVEDIELQFLNGWIKNTAGYSSAKMINGVVYINLLCSSGTNTAGTSICYIKDQKFRPKTSIPFIIGTNDGLYVNGFVGTNGLIIIDNFDIPHNAWTSICVSYPIL